METHQEMEIFTYRKFKFKSKILNNFFGLFVVTVVMEILRILFGNLKHFLGISWYFKDFQFYQNQVQISNFELEIIWILKSPLINYGSHRLPVSFPIWY